MTTVWSLGRPLSDSADPPEKQNAEHLRPREISLTTLTNDALLAWLDQVLLEVERRLLQYAQSGAQLQAMADEGLLLATRAGARLRQSQSAATHAAGHLQVVGIGDWRPRSTNPGWSDDPRVRGPRDHADDG